MGNLTSLATTLTGTPTITNSFTDKQPKPVEPIKVKEIDDPTFQIGKNPAPEYDAWYKANYPDTVFGSQTDWTTTPFSLSTFYDQNQTQILIVAGLVGLYLIMD
jgi:hypothetical protein